ncbi:hypothetical protein WCLP8_50029 [uncultured Gammaproteobacteria bacterium]
MTTDPSDSDLPAATATAKVGRGALQAVRDRYGEIGLMRENGMTWNQISTALARLGVLSRANRPLSPATLRSAFFLVGVECRHDELVGIAVVSDCAPIDEPLPFKVSDLAIQDDSQGETRSEPQPEPQPQAAPPLAPETAPPLAPKAAPSLAPKAAPPPSLISPFVVTPAAERHLPSGKTTAQQAPVPPAPLRTTAAVIPEPTPTSPRLPPSSTSLEATPAWNAIIPGTVPPPLIEAIRDSAPAGPAAFVPPPEAPPTYPTRLSPTVTQTPAPTATQADGGEDERRRDPDTALTWDWTRRP